MNRLFYRQDNDLVVTPDNVPGTKVGTVQYFLRKIKTLIFQFLKIKQQQGYPFNTAIRTDQFFVLSLSAGHHCKVERNAV